jgi:hypothetical protein
MAQRTVDLNGKKWVYYINKAQPHPEDRTLFRVSIVIENERGHYPTGNADDKREPWYWNEETCKMKNEERGFSEVQVFEIVSSSMFANKGQS